MALARFLARKRRALVLPPLCYGSCWETRHLAGTISLEAATLRKVAQDILEDLYRNGARKVLVLSGHGGGPHMMALREGAQRVAVRHPNLRAAVLCDYNFAYELLGKDGFPQRDGHAGYIETSRLLAVAPRLVKGHTRVRPDWPGFGRFEIVSAPEKRWRSGVMGDPRRANALAGRRVNAFIERRLLELVDEIFT